MHSMKRLPASLPLAFLIVGAMVVVVWSHLDLDKHTKKANTTEKFWLPSYETVQLVSLGYDRFLADLFWLAFVQYAGDPVVSQELPPPPLVPFRYAYQFADLVTRLDPQFSQPYWFGCWTIGYSQYRPDLADKILQRGIMHNPKEWYMYYMAGINQYLFARNGKGAATYYHQAAMLPGAPDFLERQAEILRSGVPDQFNRLRTMEDLMQHTTDQNLKDTIKGQLIGFWNTHYKRSTPKDPLHQIAANKLKVLATPDELKELGIEVE